jgi:hypothetical protein
VCETCNFSRHQQLLANLLYIHQQILTTSQTITLIPEPYTASESFPSLFLPRAVPKNNHKPVSDMNSPSAHPPSPPLLLPLRPVNSTTPPGSSPTLHISHEAVQGRLLYACELCELEITPYLCANCVQPIHARTQLNLPAATGHAPLCRAPRGALLQEHRHHHYFNIYAYKHAPWFLPCFFCLALPAFDCWVDT